MSPRTEVVSPPLNSYNLLTYVQYAYDPGDLLVVVDGIFDKSLAAKVNIPKVRVRGTDSCHIRLRMHESL